MPRFDVEASGQQKSAVKADKTLCVVQSDFVRRVAVASSQTDSLRLSD